MIWVNKIQHTVQWGRRPNKELSTNILAQGTLLNVMWQPGQEGEFGEN